MSEKKEVKDFDHVIAIRIFERINPKGDRLLYTPAGVHLLDCVGDVPPEKGCMEFIPYHCFQKLEQEYDELIMENQKLKAQQNNQK